MDPSGRFTLTELVVVVTVIAVLGAVFAGSLSKKKHDAEQRIAVAYGKDPLQYEIERGNVNTNGEFLSLSSDEQQTLLEFWNRNGDYEKRIELARAGNQVLTANAAQTLFAANDVFALGLGGVGLIGEGDAAADLVYRVIRADENPALGLFAKNPSATYTVEGHIINGSRPGWASQYISTTRKAEVAQAWAAKSGNRIVAIDLNKVNGTIYDLSTEAGRNMYLKGTTAKNFAGASAEVLIQGDVPANAVKPF